MKNYIPRTALLITFLLAIVMNAEDKDERKPVIYATLQEMIDSLLPEDGLIEKDTVVINKKQAKELNKICYTGYKKGKAFEVNILKNKDKTIDSYVIRLKLTIYEFESDHDYIIQFGEDKKLLRKVDVLELNDEYAELTKQDDFFYKQFVNIGDVDTLELDENIDAVTEATLTSELTINAVKAAKYLLCLL